MKIGIDVGGTKLAAVVLDDTGETVWRERVPTPRHAYDDTIAAVADLVRGGDAAAGTRCTVGVGIPGSLVRGSGVAQNSNLTWINGRPFGRDLSNALDRDVRVANDANCFALSEAVDGAGAGFLTVFGIIIGTGCGGGLIHGGRIVNGPHGIGGEWGHLPLPWPQAEEIPGPACWCGRRGCMEVWASGSAMERDHEEHTGTRLPAADIFARREDDASCAATLNRHLSRLARGMTMVIDIFDPDVIVLGGGLSNMAHLYEQLPIAVQPHVFAAEPRVDIRPPKYGDASGVRGAAWLWGDETNAD